MGADSLRHVILVGLEVADDSLYAEYRAAMLPILERYGGRFEYDFTVGALLKSKADQPINRVFTISFPGREARTGFFSDEHYLEVRAKYFEPAVTHMVQIAEFESAD